MKSKLEQLYEKERADKFKMSGLDWQPANCDREILPTSLDAPKRDDQANYRKLMSDYRQRFGMDALQVEGLAKRDDGQSLSDRVVDNDRERSAGMKLAVAKVNYQGKPVKLWFEITRF